MAVLILEAIKIEIVDPVCADEAIGLCQESLRRQVTDNCRDVEQSTNGLFEPIRRRVVDQANQGFDRPVQVLVALGLVGLGLKP